MEEESNERQLGFIGIHKLANLESSKHGFVVSKEAVATLTDVTFEFLDILFEDLNHFAKHGGRKQIKVEDVKLCGRKERSITDLLDEYDDNVLREGRESRKEANANKKLKKLSKGVTGETEGNEVDMEDL